MIIQKHGITAVAGGVTLKVKTAKVTLDDGWSPFGQVTLVCALPSAGNVDLIDPRTGVRLSLTLTRDVGAQSRTFDLVVTDRIVDHDAATLEIIAATDEALLQTKARVATTVDTTSKVFQSSLRQILDYVVLASIGAALEVDGGPDWDATIDTNATNLILNPSNEGTPDFGFTATRCVSDTNTGWAATGTKCINLYSASAPDCFVSIGGDSGAMRLGLLAGKTYVFSATGRVKAALGGSEDGNARRLVAYYKVGGSYLNQVSPQLPTTVGVATRVAVEFTIPPTATEAFVRVYLGHTVGEIQWDAFRLSEKTGNLDDTYFDGATPDGPIFTYAWTGTANASTSTRIGNVGRDQEMLDWKPGQMAWDFVAPLIEASGLRLYCDEARKWRLVDPITPVEGLVNITSGVNLTEGRDKVSRSKDWCDSVVVEYRWTDTEGAQQTAWDVADDGTPSTTLTIRRDSPYPGPGAAQAILSRATGRGRVLEIGAISDYKASPGVAVQATMPGTPIQTGYISAVTWSLPADEMAVTSRGLVDTPPTAWAFLAPGVAWDASAVGASWASETI